MIEINSNGKVKIHWKVSPYDYSKDKEKEIISMVAKKYGISKDNIKVSPDFIMVGANGESTSITDEVIDDIQDPIFQQKLFKEYLKINNVENYEYEIIDTIDKDINSKIDYQVYDKFRKFSIKWVKFSNFQSYGNDNYFDFSNLNGLILLNGEPANQSGKTTFAVDLLHFLLFGKSEKAEVQADIFNRFLPEETKVVVEGCLNIDNEDYIIKRTISRTKLEKRGDKNKSTQKVEYYHIVGDETEELEDYIESETEDSTKKTNKVIKETIGREEDFDLIMCITGSNLDSLINDKPTDRGRLFSRWIGLLPLETKEILAKEKFNTSIKPTLLSNQYDKETLTQEIEAYKVEIEELKKIIEKQTKDNEHLDSEINSLETTKNTLLESKQKIDTSVLKLDIATLRASKQRKIDEGNQNKAQLKIVEREIAEIGNVDFSVEEYDKTSEELTKLTVEQQTKRNEALNLKALINKLKTSEYCPTCGKKLDNVDNSKQISEQEELFNKLVEEGKAVTQKVNDLTAKLTSMKENRDKYIKLNSIVNQKPILELTLERLRGEYKDLVSQENEYIKNAEAIDKNNNIDISIRNTDVAITTKRSVRDTNIRNISLNTSNIGTYNKEITKRLEIIEKIEKEEKLIYHWKLYLEMVGKNGISKMVMRKVLPIINARLSQLLDDVCDFDINVEMNQRNEVTFKLIKNGIASDLNSGSGFEKTASALALRCVLADISTIPRMNGLVLDEILGRVASENYENMKMLYDRISKSYSYVFHITHIEQVKDWHDAIVTVTKNSEGISSLKTTKKN